MIGSILPNPRLRIQDTGTPKGRGVFANLPIEPGEVVEESPVIVLDGPWEGMGRELRSIVYNWQWLCEGETGRMGLALGLGSLFNHSDTPNLGFSADPQRQALVFTALRPIEPGDELTIDYNADMGVGYGPSWFEAMGITPLP